MALESAPKSPDQGSAQEWVEWAWHRLQAGEEKEQEWCPLKPLRFSSCCGPACWPRPSASSLQQPGSRRLWLKMQKGLSD
ncbi:hypothetical protein GN956_G8975 [Arapaima gigas]